MKTQALPFIGGFYADETRPWSQQDVCNWLPCATESEGTRTNTLLKTAPGLSPLVLFNESNSPIRGVYVAENRLFVVVSTTVYLISNTLVAIPLGTIPGTGRVRFAHNQIANGNQVLMAAGSSGYVYNTASGVFAKITDEGYPGAIDAVFIDGFIVQIEPARRYAFSSAPADATDYNTLDRFTSEVSPDLLVGMAVSNNELLLLSESTGEFFYDSGAAQQPFRSKRISFQKGCAGRYTVATMDNTVLWLGNDGVFYALDGYNPRRISNRPIEQAIRGLNWAQAVAMVWEDAGHSVCYWTFPDGLTFGYDASQRLWHRRSSESLDRWRANGLAYWGAQWVAGDFQYGRLWALDWDYPREGDKALERECTGPVMHDNQNLVKMPRLEFIVATGQVDVPIRTFTAQPEGPTISGSAPDGIVATVYGPFTYTITPGDAAIATVEIVSGTLPAGLTMSNAGTITGTPTESGDAFTITVRVTDTNGLWDELTDTIAIAAVTLITGQYRYGGDPDAMFAMSNATFTLSQTAADTSDDGVVLAAKIVADNNLHIYRFSGASGLYVAQTITGATPTYANEVQWVAVSPTGLWVLAHHQTTGEVYAYQYTGSGYTLINTFATGIANSRGIVFSPGGDRFAMCFEGPDPRTYTFNQVTGAIALESTAPVAVGSHRILDWVGQYVLGGEPNSGEVVKVWDADNGLALVAATDGGNSGLRAYFSADLAFVYCLGNEAGPTPRARVYAFNPTAGTLTAGNGYLLGGDADGSGACINTVRSHLFTSTTSGTQNKLYRIEGADLVPLTSLANQGTAAVWTNIG